MVRLFGGKLKEKKEFQVKINFKAKLPSEEYDTIYGLWVKSLLSFRDELREKMRLGKISKTTYEMISKALGFEKYLEQGVKSDEGLAAVFEAATRKKSTTPSMGSSMMPTRGIPASPTASMDSMTRTSPTSPSVASSPSVGEATSVTNPPSQSVSKTTPSFDIPPPPPMPVSPKSEHVSPPQSSSSVLSSSLDELREMSTQPTTTNQNQQSSASRSLPPPIPPPPPTTLSSRDFNVPASPSSIPASPSSAPASPSSIPASPSLNVPKISIRASPVTSEKRRVQSLQSEEERATGIAVLRQRMLAQLRAKKESS